MPRWLARDRVDAEAQPLDAAAAEAVDEDVRVRDQRRQRRVLVRPVQVEVGRAHADVDVGPDRLVLEGLVAHDVQHLGAVLRQRPRRGRAGDDVGQRQRLDPRQRLRRVRRPGHRVAVGDLADLDQVGAGEIARPRDAPAIPRWCGASRRRRRSRTSPPRAPRRSRSRPPRRSPRGRARMPSSVERAVVEVRIGAR